jgi:hypothetical protein
VIAVGFRFLTVIHTWYEGARLGFADARVVHGMAARMSEMHQVLIQAD